MLDYYYVYLFVSFDSNQLFKIFSRRSPRLRDGYSGESSGTLTSRTWTTYSLVVRTDLNETVGIPQQPIPVPITKNYEFLCEIHWNSVVIGDQKPQGKQSGWRNPNYAMLSLFLKKRDYPADNFSEEILTLEERKSWEVADSIRLGPAEQLLIQL